MFCQKESQDCSMCPEKLCELVLKKVPSAKVIKCKVSEVNKKRKHRHVIVQSELFEGVKRMSEFNELEMQWIRKFILFVQFMESKKRVGSAIYHLFFGIMNEEQQELYYLVLNRLLKGGDVKLSMQRT
jgi:hypothetical protein